MRYADLILQKLSYLDCSRPRIIYLVTEDRNYLKELFETHSSVLKALAEAAFMDNPNITPENMYRFCIRSGFLHNLNKNITPTSGNYNFHEIKTKSPSVPRPPFYFLQDFHLLDPTIQFRVLQQFLDFSQDQEQNGHPRAFLFLLSPLVKIPMGFREDTLFIDIPGMDDREREALLVSEAERYLPEPMQLTEEDRYFLAEAAKDFKGIGRSDILDILKITRALYGCFYGKVDSPVGSMENRAQIQQCRRDLVSRYKQEAAQQDSTVTLLQPSPSISGMQGYLEWLNRNRPHFQNPKTAAKWGIRVPKGVLFTGVPGTGKTQAAKYTAWTLGDDVALIPFRKENILGGLVGDSEANFKRLRKRAEELAPVVVLFDEIEKIFSTDKSSGNSVQSNLLAALLDWLQEGKEQVFFFATCNSVEALPPELLRDGRFDKRFYAFLPTHAELIQIMAFQMAQLNRKAGYNLYSGFGGVFQELAESRDKRRQAELETVAAKELEKLAGQFLDSISAKSQELQKDLFFTGANTEVLISVVNQSLYWLYTEKGDETCLHPTEQTYLKHLLKAAVSTDCQPYGLTNMRDIVNFWLQSRYNGYASAGGFDLLPFHCFSGGKFLQLPACSHPYDTYLQQRLKLHIENTAKNK